MTQSDIRKYTFADEKGRVPITKSGKVQWLSNKAEAVQAGKDLGMTWLIELDEDGKILSKLPLNSMAN